uniref:BMP3 bone morphogenetic protein 3 n=1 Tax=Phallusia mammillata TaxID=59560 RepID=A0A6F9D8A2_9ASCI|nr:BMP3 bone morphogenetic protein 3 [Phallusia mammillata]
MSHKRFTFIHIAVFCLLLALCLSQASAKRSRKGGKGRRGNRPSDSENNRSEVAASRNNSSAVASPELDVAVSAEEEEVSRGSSRTAGRSRSQKTRPQKRGKKRKGRKGKRGRKRPQKKVMRDVMRKLFGFDHMIEGKGRLNSVIPIDPAVEDSGPIQPPEFMLELYQSYKEDSSMMHLKFGSHGNTVRSFFSVAGNIPSKPRGLGKPITIASVDPADASTPTSSTSTSRQMRVYAFNVTTIPKSESVVKAELRLDGQKSSLGDRNHGNRSQWVVYVGSYQIEPMEGREHKLIYRRVSNLVSLRQTTSTLWQDRELARAVKTSRQKGHVLIAKFFNEGDATLYRIARDATSSNSLDSPESPLPSVFVAADTERSKRDSGDNRNHPTPAQPRGVDIPASGTPVLVVYCNDSNTIASLPDSSDGESLLNSTMKMTSQSRSKRSSRRLENPDRPSSQPKNDLPDEVPKSSQVPGELDNMQTEPPGSEIMSTLKPSKQRKNKKARGKKRKKCRKSKKKKGKRKGCKPKKSHVELNSSSLACGRKPMLVDFEEIGWSSWIVAPHTFSAYYCAGTCTLANSKTTNPTNHAIIQINLMATNPEVPAPCCVPDKLEAISVLYLDANDIVVLKTFNDMVVNSCRCR